MSTDDLITQLARDLTPVPSSARRAGAVLMVLCFSELALFLATGIARPDLGRALTTPVMWWKLIGLGLVALIGLSTALASVRPEHRPVPGLILCALVGAGVLMAGAWLAGRNGEGLAARLAWRDGILCVAFVVALSTPPAVFLVRRLRRGAPTSPRGAAFAVGLGAAAWAAFVFVFACRHDDPLYVMTWYGLSLVCVALVSWAVLPRLLRW